MNVLSIANAAWQRDDAASAGGGVKAAGAALDAESHAPRDGRVLHGAPSPQEGLDVDSHQALRSTFLRIEAQVRLRMAGAGGAHQHDTGLGVVVRWRMLNATRAQVQEAFADLFGRRSR